MSDDELQITTADMLEIVAGGGNGVEYVDVCGLIETAAKELREKDDEITRLRAENEKLLGALNDVASAVHSTRASIGVACIDIQVIDRARIILEGATK